MNLPSLDLRSWGWPVSGGIPAAGSASKASPPLGFPWGHAPRRDDSGEEVVAVSPGCRLSLEGWDGQDGACDILELSALGVTISLSHGPRSPWGERGELLIGPPGGDHYALPVAVRRVRHSPDASILELVFPENERWAYHPGRRGVTTSTSR
ncbi:MAG: hypothetical protein FJ083_06315 [Cyanobacteria bacterium K_Offshore_surface_m2_239]|nr:hypothetical protein [Cyanobacteria bacterium K_Offshore_surface_m2_239]